MKFKDLIIAPKILIANPQVDMSKFAVIACDQFTSQSDYWTNLDHLVGTEPSSLRMIFPEVYLAKVDHGQYIKSINETIEQYLKDDVLVELEPSFILVERSTPYTKRRLGIMIAIDLDQYSYTLNAQTPIRASEATIVERLPVRLAIRENAPIEIPHILMLFEDEKDAIISSLFEKRFEYPLLYNFYLNQNGGHLKGYQIKETLPIIEQFYQLEKEGLIFVIGDGNHSLASAKAHWDKIKSQLDATQYENHPARYALVEAINIYDDGLLFEPIHRVIFNAGEDFLITLKEIVKGQGQGIVYTKDGQNQYLSIPLSSAQYYEEIQQYIDQYVQKHPQTSVDYVHGDIASKQIVDNHQNAMAILMPSLTKKDIFTYLKMGKLLPRKSFSLGHAEEKRYYFESRKIK